jgi:hypothetical protein
MTTTKRPPRLPAKKKAPVLRLVPIINKPLNTLCTDVTVKLKRALHTAQSGATVGALVIALDHKGGWSVNLAGQLVQDDSTLCLIACRLLGACLAPE